MRSLTLLLLLVCVALLLAACAGASGPQPEDPAQSTTTPEFALPAPDSLGPLTVAPRQPSYAEVDLVRLGRDFDPGFPSENVNATGSSVEFQASWLPGQGTDGLSYCIYGFGVPGYDRAAEINTTWSVEPTDQDSVYFGLANWDANRWDWYAADNPLSVASFDPYLTDDKDELLLVVAVIDSGAPVLDKIQLGPAPDVSDWLHSWGGDSNEYFSSVATNHADAVYLSGYCESFGEGSVETVLVKYSVGGNFQWARTWGGPSSEYYTEVAVADDGQVYTVGTTFSFGEGAGDVLLQGWSENGVLSFTRTWGTAEWDRGNAMAVSGNYLYVLGTTDRGPSGDDAMLFKFDRGVNQVLWSKYFGGDFAEGPGSIYITQPTPGNDLIHVAFELGVGADESDIAYCQFDGSGNLLLQKQWQNATYEADARDIVVTSGAAPQIFICGFADTAELGEDMLLLEYSTEPSYLARGWSLEPDGTTRANGLILDTSGNLMLAGMVSGIGTDNSGLLARISPAGNLLSADALASLSSAVIFDELVSSPGLGAFLCGKTHLSDDCSWEATALDSRDLTGSWADAALDTDALAGVQRAPTVGVVTEVSTGISDTGGGQTDCLSVLVAPQ